MHDDTVEVRHVGIGVWRHVVGRLRARRIIRARYGGGAGFDLARRPGLEGVVRAIDVRVTVEQQHRFTERNRVRRDTVDERSAAVRRVFSAVLATVWAGVSAGGLSLNQGSASLLDPPGTLTVTNSTCDCSHITFSTYSPSSG